MTIGRQRLYVAESSIKDAFALAHEYKNDAYCDQLLLDRFGASKVDSVDFSGYEGASVIHDMNLPLPERLTGRYDTVIDGGCLEHIFNVPQALLNCSAFCKPGAQILHMVPANNCCGHGFWQFSPELFFSVYSEKNGYSETEVFLADLSKPAKWFRVKPPVCRERVNVHSASQAYVLVRTVLKEGRFSHAGVQQSDYVLEWEDGADPSAHSVPSSRERVTRCLKRVPLLHRVSAWAYHPRIQCTS